MAKQAPQARYLSPSHQTRSSGAVLALISQSGPWLTQFFVCSSLHKWVFEFRVACLGIYTHEVESGIPQTLDHPYYYYFFLIEILFKFSKTIMVIKAAALISCNSNSSMHTSPHVKKRGERGTKRIVPRAMEEDFCSPHSLAQWGTKLATFSCPAQKTSGC